MKIAFEKVISDSGSSFATREKRERGFKGIYHFHPELELTQILKGGGHRFVGDNISPFAEGDLVLLGPNLPHRYTSDPGDHHLARARVVQFSEDHLGGGILTAPESADITLLLERASRGLSFGRKTSKRADEALAQLFAAKGFRRLICLLEVLELLATCRDARPICSAGYISNLSSFESDKVNSALNYLHKHLEDPLSLTDMAKHLKMSPSSCNRLFKKSLGKSFKSLLIEVRVSHACKLLVETDATIIVIAQQCGFTNLSNFNRRFKDFSGTTPRDYRARLLKR